MSKASDAWKSVSNFVVAAVRAADNAVDRAFQAPFNAISRLVAGAAQDASWGDRPLPSDRRAHDARVKPERAVTNMLLNLGLQDVPRDHPDLRRVIAAMSNLSPKHGVEAGIHGDSWQRTYTALSSVEDPTPLSATGIRSLHRLDAEGVNNGQWRLNRDALGPVDREALGRLDNELAANPDLYAPGATTTRGAVAQGQAPATERPATGKPPAGWGGF